MLLWWSRSSPTTAVRRETLLETLKVNSSIFLVQDVSNCSIDYYITLLCSASYINEVLTSFLFFFFKVDFLRSLFSRTLGLSPGEKVLDELSLDGVAHYILSGKCKYKCYIEICNLFQIFLSHNVDKCCNCLATCSTAVYCLIVFCRQEYYLYGGCRNINL